jgi:ABC-type multidrug transport system ATPase subunit
MRVELDRLRLCRGASEVLRVPRLRFPASGVVLVSGANGSGKTTLLETLALLRPPAAGTVRFDGEDAFAAPGRRLDVTLVLQEPVLFGGTVLSNVELPLRIRGVARRERRLLADEALDSLDALALAKRPARRISAGERKRAAIARSLCASPRLLLLDEPFAHLDPGGIECVRRCVRRAAGEQQALVILSSPPDLAPDGAWDALVDLDRARALLSLDERSVRFNPERSYAR